MTSDLIDLGSSKALTTIEWEADTPSGTVVEIRTRTGNDLREINRYFKKDGTEVANKEEYEKQPAFFRGEILTEFLPGPGWSNWSQVYVKPGEVIRSPNPRRYMMIQARLLSEDAAAAASLESIQIHFYSAAGRAHRWRNRAQAGCHQRRTHRFRPFHPPLLCCSEPGIRPHSAHSAFAGEY